MASTNFLQVNSGQSNQENDAAYAADSQRTGGFATDATWPSVLANKMMYQFSTFITAFANMMVAKNYSPTDTSLSALEAVLANVLTNADGQPAWAISAPTTTTTLTPNNRPAFYGVIATGGPVTINLYSAATAPGQPVTISKTDASGNAVTIQAPGGQIVFGPGGGANTYVLTAQGQSITILPDGAINWDIVAKVT